MNSTSDMEPGRESWPEYDQVIVVDFLASPGYFNYPLNPPLNDLMIANAIGSGITAVNLTVSGSNFADTVQNIAGWMNRIERYPEAFTQVRTVDQLLATKRERKLGIVFGFQDTTPFEGGLEKIEIFLNLGVKVTQLTYNIRNLAGDGCLEPANGGLTGYGHAIVERMNELGMIVDLSHCGQRTTAQGISASSVPVAITHSGCNSVARHPRSKDDAELRALAEAGGVIGIYFMGWLSTRWKLTNIIFVLSILAALGMVIFAMVPNNLSLLLSMIFLIGILQQGGFTGLYGAAAKAYPTEIRSTGIGWSIGLGRTGAVAGPAAAGYLIAAGFSMSENFIFFSIPMAIGGIIAYRLHIR